MIFDISTLGVADNQLTFNDEALDPYFRVIRRFPTKRELEEFEALLPEQMGVNDYQSLVGKEMFIIEGKLLPSTEQTYYQGLEALRKVANLSFSQADSLTDTGYVPYRWSEEVPKQMQVKVLYVDIIEDVKQGFVQPFRLFCKVKYPIITGQTPKTVTLTPTALASANVAVAGGFKVPMAIPLLIGGGAPSTNSQYPVTYPVIWGSSGGGSASGSATNLGTFSAFPASIQISGPIQTPRITNNTTGQYIELQDNLVSANDSALISYNQSSISIVSRGLNAYGKLTSGSSLWQVSPGPNTFTLTGASIGSGAKATISFYDTWPIS